MTGKKGLELLGEKIDQDIEDEIAEINREAETMEVPQDYHEHMMDFISKLQQSDKGPIEKIVELAELLPENKQQGLMQIVEICVISWLEAAKSRES